MKCIINKYVWNFSEVSDLLAGTDLLVDLMRNSRVVSFTPTENWTLEKFLEDVASWASDNISNMIAFELVTSKLCARIFFESKADLAKFLVKFEGYSIEKYYV